MSASASTCSSLIINRLHRLLGRVARTMYIDVTYCYRPSSMVCQSVAGLEAQLAWVSLSVGLSH